MFQRLRAALNWPLPDATPRLTEEQAAEWARNTLFWVNAQVALMAWWSAKGTDDVISAMIDKVDVGSHTFLRLYQVFGNVIANWDSSDQEKPGHPFYRNIVNVSPMAHVGIAGAALIIPAAIAFGIHYNETKRLQNRRTATHQINRIQTVTHNHGLTEHEYLEALQDLLDRGKIEAAPEIQEEKKPDVKANTKPTFKTRFIDPTIKAIGDGIKATWKFLTRSAILFWPTWMSAVLVVGFTASYALPVLPIVIAVSFGLAGLIASFIAYLRHKQAKKEAALTPADRRLAEQQKKEANRMTLQLMPKLLQRGHMKLVQKHFKETFGEIHNQLFPRNHGPFLPRDSSYRVNTVTMEKTSRVVVLIKKPEIPAPAIVNQAEEAPQNKQEQPTLVAEQHAVDQATMEEYLKNSDLGKRVLGRKWARSGFLGLIFADTFISYYTLSAFIWWLLGSAFLALGLVTGLAPALIGVAVVCSVVANLLLGGIFPGIAAALNVAIGIGFGLDATKEAKKNRKELVEVLYKQLKTPYRVNNQRWENAIREAEIAAGRREPNDQSLVTREEAFNYFKTKVDEAKERMAFSLREAQAAIKRKVNRGERLTPEEQLIRDIKLKEIDVYNDRYFKTQETSIPWKRRVSHFFYQLYKAINGGQTGIFVIRSLFLAGAALAMACAFFGPGAPIAFIAIAATFGVVALTLKLLRMRLESKERNKRFFAETLPERISYLKKQYKQLSNVEAYLNNNPAAEEAMDDDIQANPHRDRRITAAPQALRNNENRLPTQPAGKRPAIATVAQNGMFAKRDAQQHLRPRRAAHDIISRAPIAARG